MLFLKDNLQQHPLHPLAHAFFLPSSSQCSLSLRGDSWVVNMSHVGLRTQSANLSILQVDCSLLQNVISIKMVERGPGLWI